MANPQAQQPFFFHELLPTHALHACIKEPLGLYTTVLHYFQPKSPPTLLLLYR